MSHDENDLNDFLSDPEKFYSRPALVSADDRWNAAEKRKILEAWEANEQALIRAASEGLQGGERPHLRDVIEELKKLG